MKITIAENLRHFLGDVSGESVPVFAEDENGEFYEVSEVTERNGYVVLKLGTFHHYLPADTHLCPKHGKPLGPMSYGDGCGTFTCGCTLADE